MSEPPKKIVKKPSLVSVTTINVDGSRYFLHPADVRGRFTRWRRIFAFALLALYVLLPWIPVNGAPAVFLDVANRKFHLFGLTFLAQDLWLGFFVVTGLGFALFYATALAGRLWCGWACPYTVFLEHVFRRIERWVDGDAPARRRLDAAPVDGAKARKRVVKHGLYLLGAALIAHLFLSYFVSIPQLYSYIKSSPTEHVGAFAVVVALTGVLYFCFAWFREQFCIILCPYGRIQSALTDDDTMVIGYDERRGEPRGKATDPSSGDCVACNRCVQVCPTGIDIRDGLQIECIGCAACVDACDEIMAKVGREPGLVRYDSLNGLATGKRKIVRPRILAYTGLLVAGLAAMVFSLRTVKPFHAIVTRMAGLPSYETPEGVRNQFQLRVVNKRNRKVEYVARAVGLPDGGVTRGLEDPVVLEAQGEQIRAFTVNVPKDVYVGPFPFEVEVESGVSGAVIHLELRFVGPDAGLLARDAAPTAAGAEPGGGAGQAGGEGNQVEGGTP